jgi:hypothetical protein
MYLSLYSVVQINTEVRYMIDIVDYETIYSLLGMHPMSSLRIRRLETTGSIRTVRRIRTNTLSTMGRIRTTSNSQAGRINTTIRTVG